MANSGDRIVTNGPKVRSLHVQGKITHLIVKGGYFQMDLDRTRFTLKKSSVPLNGIEIYESFK